MLWKVDDEEMKVPSKYKIDIEDLDKESYRSVVNGTLIDTVIAKGMLKCQFEYNYLTEAEAEHILAKTFKNPMNVTIKSPSIPGGIIAAEFRCSKRSAEMYRTGVGAETSKWKVSFNLVQKKKTSTQ